MSLHARSSSAPSLFMSRVAIYKPPRSSPLSGPVIASNDDEDEEGEEDIVSTKDEKTQTRTTSTTPSRTSSPYPTPPRTPSPNAEGSEFGTRPRGDITSTRSHSSLYIPSLAYVRPPPQIYVRTPFSAPPTMRESHPTYDTGALIARADRRSRKAPPPPSSSPHERGTFSAPAVIRPVIIATTPEKKHSRAATINPQLDANDGNSSLSSSSAASRRPDLTWLTVSNVSPLPFSRTRLKGVVMPVKASRAEKSTKRPKTAPTSRSSFLLPAPAEGVKMLQPMEPLEEVGLKRCQSLITTPRSIANSDTEETESKYTVLKNDRVNADEEVVKASNNVKRWKWKQFLEKVGNVVRN